MLAPHTRDAAWPDEIGPLAESVRRADPGESRLALLGTPDDLGVRLNAGRPGAADGPRAFRAALARQRSTHDAVAGRPLETRLCDAGDVAPAHPSDHGGDPVAALEETHRRVREACAALHGAGLVPVCVGGGHDLTLPGVTALADASGRRAGGVNVDAHLDVRDAPGSGMPFRRLIESDRLDPARFVEFGIARFACDPAHLAWLAERGAAVVAADVVLASSGEDLVADAFDVAFGADARGPGAAGPGFLSIDLDAIDASSAPGVSAPAAMGLGVPLVAEIARRAGADPRVGRLDIMELNPAYDADARTARVAALLLLSFLTGFAERPA